MTTRRRSTPDFIQAVKFARWSSLGEAKTRVATCKYTEELNPTAWRDSYVRLNDRDELQKLMELSKTHNVFVCSASFDEGHNFSHSKVVWADIDSPRRKDKTVDRAKLPEHMEWIKADALPELRRLGAMIVASGSEGGYHIRLKVSRKLDKAELETINRLLAKRFRGDSKHSFNALLRLPGTFNHKTSPAKNVDTLRKASTVWEPEALIEELGGTAQLDSLPATRSVSSSSPDGDSFDLRKPAYAGVREAIRDWNERFEADPDISRYEAAQAIVMETARAGLSVDNAVWAAKKCVPLTDKESTERGYRIEKDIPKVWDKTNAENFRERKMKRLAAMEKTETTKVSHTDVPMFPVSALPGMLREYVNHVAKTYQVPPDLPAGLALVSISTATRRAYRVRVKAGWEEYAVMRLLGIASSGTKKSPVAKRVNSPLVQLEKKWAEEYGKDDAMRKTLIKQHEAAIERLAEAQAEPDYEINGHDIAAAAYHSEELAKLSRPRPRLVVNDTTTAKVATLLGRHDGLLTVLDTESTFLNNVKGQYNRGQAEVGILNKAYDEESANFDRQTAGEIFVNRPFLPMGIVTQPETVVGMATPAMADSGFLWRFMLMMPEATPYDAYQEHDVPEAIEKWWEGLIFRIVERADRVNQRTDKAGVEVKMTPAASRLFKDWDSEVNKDLMAQYPDLHGWLNKTSGRTARIALMLALVNEREEIQEGDVKAAIEISRYLVVHAHLVINYMRKGTDEMAVAPATPRKENDVLAKIVKEAPRRLREKELDEFTASMLHQAVRGIIPTEYKKSVKLFNRDFLPLLLDNGFLEISNDEGRSTKFQLKEK